MTEGSTQEIVVAAGGVLDPIVRPQATADEVAKAWAEYVAIEKALLKDEDYIFIIPYIDRGSLEEKFKMVNSRAAIADIKKSLKALGHALLPDRRRKKRSAFDKLARVFNLSLPSMDNTTVDVKQVGDYIVETRTGEGLVVVIYQKVAGLKPVKATVQVRVIAPNGRSMPGDGACALSERAQGADGFAHADHDIIGTAMTRALNRAISRAIGTGEVSYEELADAPGEERTDRVPVDEKKETISDGDAPREAAAETPTEANGGTASDKGATTPDADAKDETQPQAPADVETPQEKGVKKLIEKFGGEVTGGYAGKPFEPSKASLTKRIQHMERYLFGSESGNPVVRLLVLSSGDKPVLKRVLSADDKLDVDLWKKIVKGMPDRKDRVAALEQRLAALGRKDFLEYAHGSIKVYELGLLKVEEDKEDAVS